jgi:hypothetical protein
LPYCTIRYYCGRASLRLLAWRDDDHGKVRNTLFAGPCVPTVPTTNHCFNGSSHPIDSSRVEGVEPSRHDGWPANTHKCVVLFDASRKCLHFPRACGRKPPRSPESGFHVLCIIWCPRETLTHFSLHVVGHASRFAFAVRFICTRAYENNSCASEVSGATFDVPLVPTRFQWGPTLCTASSGAMMRATFFALCT